MLFTPANIQHCAIIVNKNLTFIKEILVNRPMNHSKFLNRNIIVKIRIMLTSAQPNLISPAVHHPTCFIFSNGIPTVYAVQQTYGY